MDKSFSYRQFLFLAQIFALSVVLYLMHAYLLDTLRPNKGTIIPLWTMYVFHAIAVYIVYSIINFRFSNKKKQVFNVFVLLMILKMFFIVIFLLPIFLSKTPDRIPDVINFFIPYFIFLGFEVYSITQFLSME